MVEQNDKEQKTFMILTPEAKRDLDRELALERRLMSRAIKDVKMMWKNDATTVAQKFPYLTARKLTNRGNYRNAEDAQAKLAEIEKAMGDRKRKKTEGINLGGGHKNQHHQKNKNGGAKIQRKSRTVKTIGSSSFGRKSGLKSGTEEVVQQWPVEQQIAVAAEMLTKRMDELKQLVREGKSLNKSPVLKTKEAEVKAGAEAKPVEKKDGKRIVDPWAPPPD